MAAHKSSRIGIRYNDERADVLGGQQLAGLDGHTGARTRTYVNARHLSALLFLRVPLAINDLFLQAEQKYDCLWLKYWWLCMNY